MNESLKYLILDSERDLFTAFFGGIPCGKKSIIKFNPSAMMNP